MPHYHALLHSLVECNVHIFPEGTSIAMEKVTMRDFLCSDSGADLRQEYSSTKQELEARFKAGSMTASDYNKGKGDIVRTILDAAAAWEANGSVVDTCARTDEAVTASDSTASPPMLSPHEANGSVVEACVSTDEPVTAS